MLGACLAIGSVALSQTVAAGGGGEARASQYFAIKPEFERGLFAVRGKDLSPRQQAQRNEVWRAEIRKQLYVPRTLPPLDAKVWSTFAPAPGVLADRVTYATAEGMLVPAIVYRPDPRVAHWQGKLPGIVIVNGHGGDKTSWYAFYSGILFAKAGAVTVTYDPIGDGERSSLRAVPAFPSEHDRVVDLPHWGQRLGGLMQVDAMQAVSYLRSLPEVDPARIGIAGYSMGAFVAGITGALDTRVHAVLLSGGGVFDGSHEYYDTGKLPCQAPPYRALGVLGDRGAVLYALNADRGPMYVMNGDADSVMKMSDHPPAWFAAVRERAAALRGTSAGLFTTVLYPGVSHRPSWVNQDGMLWLQRQLHFALWNEAAIRRAGTTHIATWAHANHVLLSSDSIREDREGGIDAVGTGVPAIPRADLMVLSDAEWEREKPRLIYDSWAEKAMLAETTASK